MIIWYEIDRRQDGVYVPRCSRCGRFPKTLLRHFFFTGLYCYRCVEDVLYKNVWTVKEINAQSHFEEVYKPQGKEI